MTERSMLGSVVSGLCATLFASLAGAQPSFDVIVPDRVAAGDEVDLYVIASVSTVGVEFDGKGVDVDGFVRRMRESASSNSALDPCPQGRRCFVVVFSPDVYDTPGLQTVTLTAIDDRGRRETKAVGIRIAPPVDDDANGMPDQWERRYGFGTGHHWSNPSDDPDGDGVPNIEEYRRGTNPLGKYTRYFVEGSAGERQPLRTFLSMRFLEEDITSGRLESTCHVVAIGDDGRRRQQWSTATTRGGCQWMSVLGASAVADRVVMVVAEGLFPFVAERHTLSGPTQELVNSSFGVQQASRTWYFADGSTTAGMDTYLLLYNPSGSEVEAEFTYSDARREVLRRVHRLAPGVRTTVWVNQDDPEAIGSDVAVSVRASAPVFAERAFRYASPGKTVPHESVTRGTLVPAVRWYFPDVDGRGPYETGIAVFNPSSADASLTLTTYFADRELTTRRLDLPAGLRRELSLADMGIAAGTASFGVLASAPIVAERVTVGRDTRWRRAAAGVTNAGVEWEFATGATAWTGTAERQGELVVTNVSDRDTRVTVTSYVTRPGYMGGSRGFSFEVAVPANRVTRIPFVREHDAPAAFIADDWISVKSLDGTPIIVERTHTWAIDGVSRAGASSIIGNVIR